MISESQQNRSELRAIAKSEGYDIATEGEPLANLVNVAPEKSLTVLQERQQISLSEFENLIVLGFYEDALGTNPYPCLQRLLFDHYSELLISCNLIKGCLHPETIVA